MSTITKEQAQKIIDAADAVITALAGTNEDVHPESDSMLRLWDDLNDRYAPPEVVRELARIALASPEAEPVAYVSQSNLDTLKRGHNDVFVKRTDDVARPVPLFTAPPVPVSVPDDVMSAIQKVARIRLDLNDFDGDKRGILDCLSEAEEALIEVVNRRAAMLQGAKPVTMAYKLPEGWVAMPVDANRAMIDAAARVEEDGYDAMHKAMIAAAPQLEVK
ncbi:Uncharacterised protein [Enterobacter roggenkampii]|uniref:Uncharacterized protein n=1 Tax=Enterobacter roggenkampii TaxID=1812935 RepID=A0ABY0J1V3_9ENTR|nr:hypothetical protein [Enterobacter roggenkampii]SAA61793.1 Uncharacterised protein [Enterobacter roggenkampii]